MENYLELIANNNESDANVILKEINLLRFLDNANDMFINSNGEIVESQTAAVTTTSKLWTIQKRDNSNKYVRKKNTEGQRLPKSGKR